MKKIMVINLKSVNYCLRVEIIFFVILLLTVFIPLAVSAAIYYVSTSGNDANPGTESQPWRTIQKAAYSLVAGDTVYIRSGTYAERVIPQNSGSEGNYITYAANPGDVVTIDGTGISVPEYSGLFDISGRSYIRVSGLRIINSSLDGILADGTSYIIIEKNYTYNTGSSGIGVWNSNNTVIDGNEVELGCRIGLQEYISVGGTHDFEIRHNVVHGKTTDVGKEGICAKDGSYNGKIYGNRVYDLQKVGIYVDAWDKHTYNIEVFQNVIHDISDNNGIVMASEMGGLLENIRVYNNLSYHNRYCGIGISRNGPGNPPGRNPIKNVLVFNNTLYNNGWTGWGGGIVVDNADAEGIVIRNNIVSQNLYFQIAAGTDILAQNLTIDHNLIDGYRGTEGEVYGSNYVTGDPMFMNPAEADFRLQGGSPAIDMGSSVNAPNNDFDGSIRPYGNGVDIGAYEYGAAPVPDIKVNNSDGPITLRTDDTVSIAVSLDARNSSGNNADWWLAADTPMGWHYYTYPDIWVYSSDTANFLPGYQGPLFNLSSLELANTSGLPVGTYTVYFGIDTSMNGQVDFERLYYDSIVVDITP